MIKYTDLSFLPSRAESLFLRSSCDLNKMNIFQVPNWLKVLSNSYISTLPHPQKSVCVPFKLKVESGNQMMTLNEMNRHLNSFCQAPATKSRLREYNGHKWSHWAVNLLAYLLIQVEFIWMGWESRITIQQIFHTAAHNCWENVKAEITGPIAQHWVSFFFFFLH